MIISIAITYTNELHNTLKYSSDREIIDCPFHYLSCFKFRFTTTRIELSPYIRYIIEICHYIQGTKTAGLHRNTILNLVLSSIGFSST